MQFQLNIKILLIYKYMSKALGDLNYQMKIK